MNRKESKIKARLEEVLQSIFCPVGGSWCLHGCHCEYYYDEGCEYHVLEVWPVGFEEPEEPGGQRRQTFEIGWKEDGHALELRVHIVPVEVECE